MEGFFVEVTCKPEKTKNLFKLIDGRQICFKVDILKNLFRINYDIRITNWMPKSKCFIIIIL
ncbi:MAG: hypothetical protein BGO55_01945 [Sphingobacteriales bacterium 50-39]|nr:MAG: hypothetical protein BGO55_01945 [Sphingobacteriales bacterium 50-39]